VSRALVGLEVLGYTTVEDALGVMQAAGPELARVLGVTASDLDTVAGMIAGTAISPVSAAEREAIDRGAYQLGVDLDHIPSTVAAPVLPVTIPAVAGFWEATPPVQINLIGQMPAVKNQQNRSTCVAFASLAVLEHHHRLLGNQFSFSEQFVYWACKSHDGYAGKGTWVSKAFERLKIDGVCLSASWPYNPDPVPGNESQEPTDRKELNPRIREAHGYRVTGYQQLAPTAVDDIKTVLRAGRCVAFSVPVYNSLMLNDAAKISGDIPNPVPGEIRVGGHAMCFVGYVDEPSTRGLGGGRFLIRNSWGSFFGATSQYGAGYGTISYAYISRLGAEAFALA
jgi:hypothetical protein